MIRRPPRSTLDRSSAASDVYKRQELSKVAIFQNLQPILTTIIALYLGKVILTNELAIGGVLTLIGVLLVQFG